jgi:PmbA protein
MEPEKIINVVKDRVESESPDAYEICFLGTERLSVEARDGQVESFSRTQQCGIAVRVLKDGRMGWASSTDLASPALDRLITSAVANACEASSSPEATIPKPSRKSGKKPLEKISEKEGAPLQEISEAKKIATAIELERIARTTDPRIVRVRQPLYEESVRLVAIENSNGISRIAKRQIAACEVRAIAEEKGTSESGFEYSFSPRFEDLDVEGTARRAALRSVSLLGAKPLPTGRYNVVFESRPAASLIRLLAPSFFADNVQRKKSAIAEKKGVSLYQKLVTIIDDGLLPDGFGSFPFDDEGMPRQKNFLVKDGVIVGWLYDAQRAAREKRISTGSSYRLSIHKPPAISTSNCYVKAGEMLPERLLVMAGKCFLITDVMGLHTANSVTGDFSLGAEGFYVENGVKGHPVRRVIVAGNIHDLFARVVAIGNDLKFLANYGSPSIFVPDVQISGSS